MRRFSIKAASVEEPAATLSGGNQQKTVVARWMETHARLLILEEPTIGVDVGAKADIYHLLQLALRQGLAVLLISSDFEEVERICHRALVFSRGRVVAEIPRERLTVAALTADGFGRNANRATWSDAMSRMSDRSVGAVLTRAISVWGLLVLLVLLVIVFSLAEARHFPDLLQHPLDPQQQVGPALVALSVFIPMVANHFDLSAGFNVGISQVLAIGLQGQGWPWWAAVAAVLVMGAPVGLVNGILVTRIKIDSFIATLGTGTVLYGLNAWYTGGQQVLASLPPEFLAISGSLGSFPRQRSTRWSSASPSGSCSNICRSAAISMCSARARAPQNSTAFRRSATSPSASSRRERSPPSPESCCNPSCRSARVRSVRNICCRPSPPRCSERPRSGRAGSTSGGPCSPSRCSP